MIGRLTTYEMLNFDNFIPTIVESSFKSQLVLSKKGNQKYVKSDMDVSDDEHGELEALIARRIPRGRGKYKGKLPMICNSCNKVGHIATRFHDRRQDKRMENKYKG